MPPDPGSLAARVTAAGRRCSPAGSPRAGWGTRGTPRQAGYPAEYLEAERAGRDAPGRAQLPGRCALPQAKTLDGYDWGSVAWPDSFGRDDLLSLSFLDRHEDVVPVGDVGTGKTHMPGALCALCCQSMRQARFLAASSLVMRPGRARGGGSLDREHDRLARAELLGIDELGFLPLDAGGARLLSRVVSESCERQSLVTATNPGSGRWGTVFGDDQMAAAVIDRKCEASHLRSNAKSYVMRSPGRRARPGRSNAPANFA